MAALTTPALRPPSSAFQLASLPGQRRLSARFEAISGAAELKSGGSAGDQSFQPCLKQPSPARLDSAVLLKLTTLA